VSDVEMRRSPLAGAVELLVTRKPVAWVLSKTLHLFDTPLLRLTKGRISIGWGYPVLLLTTTGAKTGRQRTVTLLYVDRGDDEVAVIGSHFGRRDHPAWYHNLNSDPACRVAIGRRTWRAVSRPADPDERAEIWAQALHLYAGYDKYLEWTEGRVPPVLILKPEK
jgi:deazaflavin-dependent oxidoreductase (nitroreductase family)